MSAAKNVYEVLSDNLADEDLQSIHTDLKDLTDTGKVQFVNELVGLLPEAEEEEVEEERIHMAHNQTLADIQRDLRKLMDDIGKLQKD